MPSQEVVDAQLDASLLRHDLDQLVVGADGDHLAVVHDADAVAELLRLFHVVGRVEHRHALVAQRQDAVQDGPPALRVDADRGLVQVEHARLVQQGHADVDAPLHAAGVLVHAVLLAVDQADELQHLVDALLELRAGKPVHAAPEQQVLAGGHVRVQGDVLRHDADDRLDRLGVRHDRVPVHEGVAPGWAQQAGEHGDGGGLAGAVGAEQAEDLALVDVEAHLVDGQHALGRVVLLAKLPHLDDAHLSASPVRSQ